MYKNRNIYPSCVNSVAFSGADLAEIEYNIHTYVFSDENKNHISTQGHLTHYRTVRARTGQFRTVRATVVSAKGGLRGDPYPYLLLHTHTGP